MPTRALRTSSELFVKSSTIAVGVCTTVMPFLTIVAFASSFALRMTLRSFLELARPMSSTDFASSGDSFFIASSETTVAPIAKLIGIEVMNLTFVYHCSATAATAPATTVSQGLYEQTHGQLGSDAVLSTSFTGTTVRAASVVYPTPTTSAAPTITRLTIAGAAVLRVDDPARNDHVLIVVRPAGQPLLSLPCTATGMPVSITTDAAIVVVDVHANGTPVTKYFEQGTSLSVTQPTGPLRKLCR